MQSTSCPGTPDVCTPLRAVARISQQGGPKTRRGATFKKYCIGCMQQPGSQTWNGGHRFQMGGPGTTGPPLATALTPLVRVSDSDKHFLRRKANTLLYVAIISWFELHTANVFAIGLLYIVFSQFGNFLRKALKWCIVWVIKFFAIPDGESKLHSSHKVFSEFRYDSRNFS